jgi:hypothetical protein
MTGLLPIVEFGNVVVISDAVEFGEAFATAIAPMPGVCQQIDEVASHVPFVVVTAQGVVTAFGAVVIVHVVIPFTVKKMGGPAGPPG